MATGWDLTPALLAAIPEALALRRSPHPHVATLRRRTAGFLAPWDGPAAIVFADGVRVGAMVDRNGLRPASFAVTRDRLVAVASEAGAVPFAATDTVRRGRLGPGELLLVEPGRRAILEDAEAKTRALRALPIHDAPRPIHEDRPEAAAATLAHESVPLDVQLRHLAGLDAERARLDIKTMALEAHEPLWSMGDDTPTPGRGRLDRPVADHLRQAFAQVTNPAIDPERERIVMDLRVELGRRPALLGGPPRGPRTLRLARPIVADLAGPARRRSATAASASAGSTSPGRRPTARPASRRRSSASRRRPSPPSEAGVEVLVLSDDGFDLERLPIPSILAAGAVHAALTEAGLRGRTDLVVDAADVLDVHAMAMLLAVGATAVHPRLAIELAAELAGTRGAEAVTPADAIERARRRPSRPGCARPSPGWASARSPRTSAGRSSTSSTSMRPSSRAASRRPRRGRAGRPSPTWPSASSGARPRRPPIAPPAPGREPRLPGSRASPGSAPTARPTCSPRRSPTEITALANDGTADDVDAALARYRDGARPRTGRPRRPARRAARPPGAAPTDLARRGRGRAQHRAPVRRVGDERRRAVARGPPGADDRDPARRRRREHRRGRRGPGLVRAGPGRQAPRRADQAGRLGPVRRDRRVPRPRGPARDQDRPGLEARRGRPAARSQGDRVHRRAASRPARPELHQPAAAPRHLLDRGPRPAHRRPARHQPGRPDRREARRRARGRDDRRGRRQGRRLVHPPVRPCRRDRRVAAVVDQARRRAVGARARRGPPGPAPQRPARPRRRSAPTAASRPAATCSSRRCSAPRSSRSGPPRSSRSAATWPASATSTPARPASPPSARTCAPSSPGTPEDVERFVDRPRRGPPPRAGGRRAPAPSARSSGRAAGC